MVKQFARWLLDEPKVVRMSAPAPEAAAIIRHTNGLVHAPEITATRPRERTPELARVYEARFSWGAVRWSVECSSYRNRCDDSLMRVAQNDKREILVWSNRIADELVVPHVVQDVRRFVAAVKELDAVFMETEESRQFIDERGHAWRRIA